MSRPRKRSRSRRNLLASAPKQGETLLRSKNNSVSDKAFLDFLQGREQESGLINWYVTQVIGATVYCYASVTVLCFCVNGSFWSSS